MNKKGFYVFLFLILNHFCFSGTAFSVPAAPDIFEIRQPDGHVFQARLKGDEWNNRIETVEGYSIKKDIDGYWYYVRYFEKDIPVLSNTYAHEAPLQGLRKHIKPDKKYLQRPFWGNSSKTERSDIPEADERISIESPGRISTVSTFNGNILFILVEFTDITGSYSETSFASFISNNISNYFNEASYGSVTLSSANETFGTANNGVVGWVNVGYPHPNSGGSTNNNNRQLTKDAIIAADPYINFSSYDSNSDGYVDADELAVVIIAAGYENSYSSNYSPKVWGHRWSLGWGAVDSPVVDGVRVADSYNGGGYAQFGEVHRSSSSNTHQATMGIMVHELGHLIFGLPDLYDIDGSSNGIGAFGVMGSGSWGKANADIYSGETPVLPCAWSRYNRGWGAGAEHSGVASIEAAGSSSADTLNSLYKLPTRIPGEYFLVENRYPAGYDRGLERWLGSGFGGLALWHIDDARESNAAECSPPSNCSADHMWVALKQADGNWDLEHKSNRGNTTDLWYSGNNSTFDNASVPNSNLYNGTSSDVSVSDISVPGITMTATLTSPVSTVYAENFESGALGAEWSTASTNEGRILVTTNHTPRGGEYHLTMDNSVQGSVSSLNELILTVDLSGMSGVMLSFFHMEIGDENHPMPASFSGSSNSDGVAISENGTTWYEVVNLGIERNAWDYDIFEVDLDGAITSAGINYTSSFKIKFQQYDDYPINYDGFAFDDIWITASDPVCVDSNENNICDSVEAEDILNLVIWYYQSILDRAPEPGGAESWTAEIHRIISLGIDVKEGFIALGKLFFNSVEYLSKGTTDSEYITDLYETFLGRTPSQGEVDAWSGELVGGLTRNLLLHYFIFSEEFRIYMEGIFGDTTVWPEYSLVNDLYRGFLSRLPDDDGFNAWLALMQEAQCTGEQAIRDLTNDIGLFFLQSDEYAARGTDNSEYIEDLYNGILRRGAELDGYLAWLDYLNSGASREEVLQLFVDSAEFQGRVHEVIDAGCNI